MSTKKFISLLFITTLSVLVVALYNGFPLTESDTGAYIEKGILSIIPQDRSPFYGWFIRYTSLWTSLWFTAFIQCLILAFLLLKYIQFLSEIQNSKFKIQNALNSHPDVYGDPIPNSFNYTLFTIIAIVSFTCISWVASYLMPDIFAGILLLAVLLFLSVEANKKGMLVLYAAIIFIAIIIHNSHFLVTAIFSSLLLLWALVKKHSTLIKRSLAVLSLSVLSWLLMCTVNAANGYDFTFSRGSHVFMVTKFAETGILNSYLDEVCVTKDLKLCHYKDQIPAYSWDFLWSPESPLYKTGGWDSNKVEYNIIIHDVFTTPRFVKMFAEKSAVATLRELSQIQAPDRASYMGNGTNPWYMIGKYFADELREYTASKQNTDGLSATSCNYLYLLFFICTSVWILFHSRIINKELVLIYCCIILFLVVNAFVTSTASTVIYRFQNRVFWILPATNFIMIITYFWRRFQTSPEEKK